MFKRYVFLEGLTSLHGSNGKYLINNDGWVTNNNGVHLPVTLDEDGHKTVVCKSWDGERRYRIIDLVAIQFKSLYIPQEDYNKVIAFCIDGNKENTHASNIGYRFQGGKLEVKGHPGYYYIPGYTYSAVNIDGVLISVKSGQVHRWGTSKPNPVKNIKGGYRVSNVVWSKGVQAVLSRHRAMMMVFKEYPDNVDKLITNHIDGIPGNDHPDNLEWSTHSQNNQHARENNLRSQQMAILTRNVETGEIKEYISLGECAKALGLKAAEAVRFRIVNARFCQVLNDGLQMKFKSDPRDWIDPKDVEKGPRKYEFTARNILTGQEHSLKSLDELSTILQDYHPRAVKNRLNMRSFEIYRGFQFRMSDDIRPFPVVKPSELENINPVGGYSVDARNLITGETRTYSTIRQAAKDFNGYISTPLRDGKQPIYEDGWQLKLSRDEWNTSEDFDKETYKNQKNIMALEVATNKVILAESIWTLSKILNIEYNEVKQAAYTRGNKVCHGYRIRLGITNDPWPTTES